MSDVTPETDLPEEFLHQNVHKLLPTLDALLFAVDATQDDATVEDSGDQVDDLPIFSTLSPGLLSRVIWTFMICQVKNTLKFF